MVVRHDDEQQWDWNGIWDCAATIDSTGWTAEFTIPFQTLRFSDNDGSVRDLTFLPRASHESITYGSSGLFTSAEDLARWCKSLFAGKVLRRSSLDQMLNFQQEGYGLGVHLIRKNITNVEKAFGHGGGNIGTSAHMEYLPHVDVSIVVMINALHGKCPDRILEDIIEIVMDHLHQEKQ